MIKTRVSLLLIVTLAFAACQKIHSGFDSQKRLVESDHFSSNDRTIVNYQIDNIQLSKPLILILRKKGIVNNKLANPVTAKIKGEKMNLECIFQDYRNLCVIGEALDQNLNMTLECKQKPCVISWVIYQPEMREVQNNSTENPFGLFTLQDSNDHLVVRITCSDPEIQSLQEDVQVYSMSHYERGGTKSEVYVLFTNQQKGFMYIDIKQKSSKCAQLKLENVPDNVAYTGQPILDFTLKGSPSSIKLNMPTHQIQLDCFLHKFHSLTKEKQKGAPINYRLFGIPKDGAKELISQSQVKPVDSEYSVSLIFKKPERQFSQLLLQASSNAEQMTIIDFAVSDSQTHEISLDEISYFSLKKGQTIKYSLVKVTGAQQGHLVVFILSDSKALSLNRNQCKASQSCEVILTAVQDVSGFIQPESKEQTNKKETPVHFRSIDTSFKTKAKLDQKIYLKKIVKANKIFRININTPNAIIYVAMPKSCQVPSDDCSEKMGNIHHPIIYNPSEDGFLQITILPLQNSEIVVTILQEKDEYITLQDGVAFGYTLYERQQRLEFKYSIAQKRDVNFNLVAPLNNLLLTVDYEKEGSNVLISTQGFISIDKNDLKGLQFTIFVQKTSISKNKQTHFTLLASTSDTVIRLQPTVAHYETIKQQTYRQYIFQYSPSQSYNINFYVHNVKQQKIKVMLALSTDRKWTAQNLDKVWIDRQSDFIDLSSLSGKLCNSQGSESCEVFLRLQNEMAIQVDITITLMVRNAIIELKDGIWQSYSQNTLISSAHFYFYPKHQDKNVVLLYHSSISSLRLSYNLWKTDQQSISPLHWPFPNQKEQFVGDLAKSSNQVMIDKQVMKDKCWPSCVVLITLFRGTKANPNQNFKDFKIMASNNQIQIPQKTRIQIAMRTSQEKQIILDLKYALSRQSLTIYNTRFFGQYVIFANLYSQKKNRCPLDGKEVSDYLLKSGENYFNIDDLHKKLVDLQIINDTSIYMCLSVRTEENCKFAIQYTADTQNIKNIHMDSFEEIKLKPNLTKYYQFQGYMEFDAKIMRKEGFPSLYIKECLVPKLAQCKQQLLQSNDKGEEIVSKTYQFSRPPCSQCIYFFKFQTGQPSVVVFHLKSKYSMNELKQHEIITDYAYGSQQNNYVMTHVTGQPLVVDIHVLEGELQARLTNSRNVNLIKQSSSQKLIHFYIKPEKSGDSNAANSTYLGQSLINPFQLSTYFSNYQLFLSNKQQNQTCTYSVTYSSGESKVYLQDGLITDITLQTKKQTTFVYYRESQSHIYLTISTQTSSNLQNLLINPFYYEIGEEEVRTPFTLQRPALNRKNSNPTLVFLLPSKKHFQIVVQNPTQKSFSISIAINHQQLIFLPLNHDYPFSLHENEELNFLTQVNQPGYVQISIRKCDESEPFLSYAHNYESFLKKQFDNSLLLKDQPFFKQLVKISKAGTLYINIKTAQNQKSKLSLNLTFYKEKIEQKQLRAGGKGIIQYQIIQSNKASVSFLPISCDSKVKCRKIKYFAESSVNLDDLYSQMICPSSYFTLIQYQQKYPITQKQLDFNSPEDIITSTVDLLDHISYVGIKAVAQNGEETYYRPIQIVTFWGQLQRTSKTHKLTLTIIILVSLVCLLTFVRYNARKGYRRIEGSQSN